MRYSPIDNSCFKQNRQNLVKLVKPGSIVLLFSNYQMPRNGDQYMPYRQQSDFFYLTGIEQEKSILLLAPDAPKDTDKEILFVLRSNPTLEIWEGHKLTPEEATMISGIKNIKIADDFDMVLHSLIPTSENLYFNIPELPKYLPEVRTRDEEVTVQTRGKYPLHNYERLAPLLQQLRLKKSATEIALIKKAIAITKDAFLLVLKTVKPGMKEYEVEAMLTHEFIRNGANGHAFAPIVASGRNACALHYTENHSECRDNELLLMDFGAEYANYAADMSRTIPINGKFNKRQLELYEATMRIYHEARKLIRPGTTINKIHDEVCKCWEEEHIRLGLYNREDVKNHTGENPLWFNYYMHGTSHFMGLDVHDVGTKEIVMEPGMILTCEPGLYVQQEGIGIRIENDILVTETGNDDLMEDIMLNAQEIELIMQKH